MQQRPTADQWVLEKAGEPGAAELVALADDPALAEGVQSD
jgi:hypothetical protein